MPLAYLATAYTLHPRGHDAAFIEACEIAAKLMPIVGGAVYSPIAHCHPLAKHGGLDPLDVKIWWPHCESMLMRCDVLVVANMESWEVSAGIAFEVERATKWQMPIFDLDPQTMTMRRRSVL